MKTKILSLFASVAMIAGLSACDNHEYGAEIQSRGRVSFATFGVEVEDNQQTVESGSRASVDVSDFIVKIVSSKDVVVLRERYASLPEVLDLPVGDYTLKVESHEVLKAEFDHPYYAGSKAISVKENEISDAGQITCVFSSIRVSVAYSDKLFPYLGEDVKVRVRVNDEGELLYVRDEKRSGYFEAVAGSPTLIWNIEGTINGQPYANRGEITDVKAGQHHIIRFKVKGLPEAPEETGTINPGEGISVDTSVEHIDKDGNVTVTEENLPGDDRPGKEDPDENDPNPPTPPVGDVFTVTCPTIDIDGINPVQDGQEYIVNITSVNPISNLIVNIISESLDDDLLGEFGLSTEFDLAHPGDLAEKLKNDFGFPINDEVIGQTEVVFNISEFVPLLAAYPDELHKFKLTIRDQKGNQVVKVLQFQS